MALSNHLLSWVQGELVSYADMNMLGETIFDAVGFQARDLLGEASFNSTGQPVTVTTVGDGNVTCGGTTLGNQSAYFLGRWCPEITPATYAVPTNGLSEQRNDFVCAKPNEALVYAFTRAVRQPDGSIVPTTCYQIQMNATWTYVQGSGPTDPAVPSGYVAVARLRVPATGLLQPYQIDMLLPTLASVIDSYVSPGGVLSLNGYTGALALTNLDGCIGIVPTGGDEILLSNLGVTSLNMEKGNVTAITEITSIDGSFGVDSPGGPTANLSSQLVTQNGTILPSGRVDCGSGTTDGSGNFTLTLPAGYVIKAISAISYDPSNLHAVGFRTVSPLGTNFVTIRSAEYHDAPPIAVPNIPFNYICIYQEL
jgi:hypothetical protein